MSERLVAIILPMYNEELSVPALRSMFGGGISLPAGWDYRIMVINDGSTDGTLLQALGWAKADSRVTVLSHTENKGLGQAILTGFYEAIRMYASVIVTMDADATHPGELIGPLLEALLDGAEMAIASRFAKGGRQLGVPFFRRLLSFGARKYYSLIFPLAGVRDYTINFRAYKIELIKNACHRVDGSLLVSGTFTATVEILLKLATLCRKIKEVPLVLQYGRKKSRSKLGIAATIRDSLKLCLLPKEKCLLGRGLRLS